MEFHHIHFYVENAQNSRDWLIQKLGFQLTSQQHGNHTQTEIVQQGNVCFFLSSPVTPESSVTQFLKRHPPGVADIAFRVNNLEVILNQAIAAGAKILQPIQPFRWAQFLGKSAKISGWGDLTHTLIEAAETPENPQKSESNIPSSISHWRGIDHVVLNVQKNDLETVIDWYQRTLGFLPQQRFIIQTEQSGLRSQVLVHRQGQAQLPINEPTSANSQIQEFLEINQGSGVQHIALKTHNLVATVRQLQQRGLKFLPVPSTYYTQLENRCRGSLSLTDLQAIQTHQILVDWQKNASPEAMLLQIFTQPIFQKPTFFLEFIERRFGWIDGEFTQVQGFGEGNFKALFEAIEREQMKRGKKEEG